MAGGLALPPASAAAPKEITQEELNEFMRATYDGFAINPANLTLDDIFGPVPDTATPTHALAPTHTPTAMPGPSAPTAMPYTADGPSWNPRIGWYYPIAGAAYHPPPPPPPMPFAAPQEGYIPVSSTMPSRMSTPLPPAPRPHAPRAPANRKRKYGPAAYLDQQAKNVAEGSAHPRAVSISKAEYTSAAKSRADRNNGLPTPRRGPRKRAHPSIVQACICSDKNALKIPRPKNAFILYRSANAHKIMKKDRTNNNQHVSRMAGVAWQNESEEVKAHYLKLAQQEKERHEQMYPEYHYQPGLTTKNKFGSASCRCGAYRANMERYMAEKGRSFDADEDESEFEELDEYVPRRSSRPTQQQAPVAPMMAPQSFPDPSTFGFAPAQQAEAQAYVNNLKRKQTATTIKSEVEEQPLAKRLRSGRSNTTYAEASDKDIESDVFEIPSTSPKTRKRPNPITTSPTAAVALDKTPSPSLPFLKEDSPARNTRSKSKGSLSLDPAGPDYTAFDYDGDFNMDVEGFDFNMDDLFATDAFEAGGPEYDGDNIVVANTRSKSRPGSRGSLGSNNTSGSKKSPTRSYELRPSTRGSSR